MKKEKKRKKKERKKEIPPTLDAYNYR